MLLVSLTSLIDLVYEAVWKLARNMSRPCRHLTKLLLYFSVVLTSCTAHMLGLKCIPTYCLTVIPVGGD